MQGVGCRPPNLVAGDPLHPYSKVLPCQSVAMVQGHLDQVRRNTWSTQDPPPIARPPTTTPTPPATINRDTMLPHTPPSISSRNIAIFVECFSATGKIFTDQASCFLHTSAAGNNDMLVLYDFDSNYVHIEAMLLHTGYQILQSYQCSHKILSVRGLHPRLQRLDNEISRALVVFLDKEGVNYQLTLPPIPTEGTQSNRPSVTGKILCGYPVRM